MGKMKLKKEWWTPFEEAIAVRPPMEFYHQQAEKFGMTKEQIEQLVKDEENSQIFKNNLYTVHKRLIKGCNDEDYYWLSIRHNNRGHARDWRHFQRIKNELVGPEHEGFEIFPAESRLVDTSNQFHLWVMANPEMRCPIDALGNKRYVMNDSPGNTKQRPSEHYEK